MWCLGFHLPTFTHYALYPKSSDIDFCIHIIEKAIFFTFNFSSSHNLDGFIGLWSLFICESRALFMTWISLLLSTPALDNNKFVPVLSDFKFQTFIWEIFFRPDNSVVGGLNPRRDWELLIWVISATYTSQTNPRPDPLPPTHKPPLWQLWKWLMTCKRY